MTKVREVGGMVASEGGQDGRLPSFDKPPVTEVALAVYFVPGLDLDATHIGPLRQRVRERFPIFEQQPPLPPIQPEVLGRAPAPPVMNISFVAGGITPRAWFISLDQTWLLQVQPDRIVLNWRKGPEGSDYPRFPVVRDKFIGEITDFLNFVAGEGLAIPTRFVGEVTYVNTIEAGAVWSRHSDMGKVFRVTLGAETLPDVTLEDATLAARYVFPNRNGEPTGRLYVQIQPVATFPQGQHAYNFTLTARGGESHDLNDFTDFINAGRDVIVRTFAAMTTGEMHTDWGQE